MIQIQGFTPLQMRLADHIWGCETATQVEKFIQSLPEQRQPIARAVQEMIIAASIDQATQFEDNFTLAKTIIDSVK